MCFIPKGVDELEDPCPENGNGKTMESEYDKSLSSELKSNGESLYPNFFSTVPLPPDSERRMEKCVNDYLADENGEIHNRSDSDKARIKTPSKLLIGLGLQKGPLIEPTHDHEHQPRVEAKENCFTERYTREPSVPNLVRNLTVLKLAEAASFADDGHQLASRLNGDGDETKVNRMGAVNNHEISNAVRFASPLVVDDVLLEKILEHPRSDGPVAVHANPGVSFGLFYTDSGGYLQVVEAKAVVGKGDLHLTGLLGQVLKESAQIALTWVKNWAAVPELAAAEKIRSLDIHIHLPSGDFPKDGPSAGVTLVTALVSLFCQKRVRKDTAMTGEITLMGHVLAVGGIKDKLLAARDYGMKRVIIPQQNLRDLREVPSYVFDSLQILPATRIEDVLEEAFMPIIKESCDISSPTMSDSLSSRQEEFEAGPSTRVGAFQHAVADSYLGHRRGWGGRQGEFEVGPSTRVQALQHSAANSYLGHGLGKGGRR